jgi:hypothetical protein
MRNVWLLVYGDGRYYRKMLNCHSGKASNHCKLFKDGVLVYCKHADGHLQEGDVQTNLKIGDVFVDSS